MNPVASVLIVMLASIVVLAALIPAVTWGHREVTRRLRLREDEQRWEDDQIDARRQLWQADPAVAIAGENFAHQAGERLDLQQELEEADRDLEEANAGYAQAQADTRGGKPVTAAYRVMTYGLLAGWFVLFLSTATLDIQLFHGMRPDSWIVPVLQGLVTAVAQTAAGVAIWEAIRPQGIIPVRPNAGTRTVIMLFGVASLFGVGAYVWSISPFRASNAGVIQAEGQRFDAKQLRPADPAAVQHAQLVLQDARDKHTAIEASDRRNMLLLVIVDALLAEAAVGGAQLLHHDAMRRRQRAAEGSQRAAQQDLAAADEQFVADLAAKVVAHGHGPEVVQAGIARYNAAVQRAGVNPVAENPIAQEQPIAPVQTAPLPMDETEWSTPVAPIQTAVLPEFVSPTAQADPRVAQTATATLPLAVAARAAQDEVPVSVIHPFADDET